VSVVDLRLALPRSAVLQVLGYPLGYAPSPGVERLLDPLIEEARGLVRARGAWRSLPVERAPEIGLEPLPADELVIGLVTVGAALEEAAADRLARGEATAALVLEACGSAAVEEAADRLGVTIVRACDTINLVCYEGDLYGEPAPAPHIGCRVSPGYARWPITRQSELFARLPHAALGVRLTESFLMLPRKSISFAMWLGAEAQPAAALSGCPRCELEPCGFRRAPRRTS